VIAGWGRLKLFQSTPLPALKSLRSQLSINIATTGLSFLTVRGWDAAGGWGETTDGWGVACLRIFLRLFRN
jgi:hypothetical protein